MSNIVGLTCRCRDCGALVHAPVDIKARNTELHLHLIGDEFEDALTRHVLWNPDIHPSFVTE